MDQVLNLNASEPEWLKCRPEHISSLIHVRSSKDQDIRSPSTDRGIECRKTIGTHDDGGGKFAGSDSIDSAYEGVHACAVLVVHLLCFARLGQRIGFIDQQ